MKVVIIGSGNVASIFANRLKKNKVNIVQIVARNSISGNLLAKEMDAMCTTDIQKIDKSADAYMISVQDDNLPDVLKNLKDILPLDALLVHTTGSSSIQLLKDITQKYGVIYPLQSLRKENNLPIDIPLLIDANNDLARQEIVYLAENISPKVQRANDEDRIRLHIAAVLVSNFSNYLYGLAENYCLAQNLDFKILLPLIKETVNRMEFFSPSQTQTGPAARKDMDTIEKHQSILDHEAPELLPIYRFLTNEILKK